MFKSRSDGKNNARKTIVYVRKARYGALFSALCLLSQVLSEAWAGSVAGQSEVKNAVSAHYLAIGRNATAAEIKAWDIDVRPDFKGLPAGTGSVAKGSEIWEAKCESCHGTFGESNEVFTPMTGG